MIILPCNNVSCIFRNALRYNKCSMIEAKCASGFVPLPSAPCPPLLCPPWWHLPVMARTQTLFPQASMGCGAPMLPNHRPCCGLLVIGSLFMPVLPPGLVRLQCSSIVFSRPPVGPMHTAKFAAFSVCQQSFLLLNMTFGIAQLHFKSMGMPFSFERK